MPFSITVTRDFSASHQLRLYDGSLEPLHGHNWHVMVTVAADRLDAMGVVMDFHDLRRRLDVLVGPMHNSHLNDLPAFTATNPSAENVAHYLGRHLPTPPDVRLRSVEVWETPDCRAKWEAEE